LHRILELLPALLTLLDEPVEPHEWRSEVGNR
jgi:hypothetical protein